MIYYLQLIIYLFIIIILMKPWVVIGPKDIFDKSHQSPRPQLLTIPKTSIAAEMQVG